MFRCVCEKIAAPIRVPQNYLFTGAGGIGTVAD